VAARDATHPHPAASQEAVALDGLLGVDGARGLVAARRRKPGEQEAIAVDQRDPDLPHPRPPVFTPLVLLPGRRLVGGAGRVSRRAFDSPRSPVRSSRSRGRPIPDGAPAPSNEVPPEVAGEPGSGRRPSREHDSSRRRTASFRGRSAGSGWQRSGGTGTSLVPSAPRSPSDWRASRGAAVEGRARRSDRQALATASPASGQDPASTRRLHTGAEAMLLGAVTLLGLIGLLHRACAGSSPSSLGAWSIPDP
jgi:hypothetical protein